MIKILRQWHPASVDLRKDGITLKATSSMTQCRKTDTKGNQFTSGQQERLVVSSKNISEKALSIGSKRAVMNALEYVP